MILEICEVQKCRDGSFGTFALRGRDRARINISLKLNESLAEYGSTLLHEMLHAFTTLLRKKGFKVTDRKEHKFIYAVEADVVKQMKKHLKRGK